MIVFHGIITLNPSIRPDCAAAVDLVLSDQQLVRPDSNMQNVKVTAFSRWQAGQLTLPVCEKSDR